MLEIITVQPDSIAAELNLKSGDKIISINGNEINDQIDYRFYSAEENLELSVQHESEQVIYEIEKEYSEDLGLELAEMKMRACGNNCVFCFVYQNPRGMRRAMYFKDEDYRFSFLYGHYVTLTTTNQKDLQRIVEQNLSPLYISVHSTEIKTRQFLLGIKRDDQLMEKIKYLVEGGIELHTQIVLCPGVNDGAIFDTTISDLQTFFPGIRSVAVVPLGLTQFRENLPALRIHTTKELQEMIGYVDKMRIQIESSIGDPFVYLADEFFIKAEHPLPGRNYYRDFYQIENGVGEFRDMIDQFNSNWKYINKNLKHPVKITWVTGTLAVKHLKEFIIDKLNSIVNLQIDLVAVKNDFYGHTIEVSGLLVGEDIFRQLKNRELGDVVFLPPRVLNKDDLFLDDLTVQELETKLNTKCYVYTENIHEIEQVLKKIEVLNA